MTAWTHVSESVYKSETPFTWRGHSWITMSVDKRGLWVSIPGWKSDKVVFLGDLSVNRSIWLSQRRKIETPAAESWRSCCDNFYWDFTNIRPSWSRFHDVWGIICNWTKTRRTTRNHSVIFHLVWPHLTSIWC